MFSKHHRLLIFSCVTLLLWSSTLVPLSSTPELAAKEPDKLADEDKKEDVKAILDELALSESPALGSQSAPVTIITFSDYQCPFCARADATLAELQRMYGEKNLRIVFKQMPLPFHKQGDEAARAAIAAWRQGGFEAMHITLFAKQKQFIKQAEQIDAYLRTSAEFMGLDLKKFDEDYASTQTAELLERDQKLAKMLGVRGTPHFFVNGKRINGAQPLAVFESAIDEELELSKTLMKKEKLTGTQVHERRFAQNYESPESVAAQEAKPKVHLIPIDKDDPVKGERDDYLVTVVMFSDFQCPFCKRAADTMKDVEKTYEGKPVRFVFKHLPLTFHKQALPAAKAAAAAHQQGKFWAMHDELFANQSDMKEANAEFFIARANAIGLDLKKFESAMKSDAVANQVEQDLELSQRIQVRGTPNFFINGIQMTGARPGAAFEEMIDDQLTIAAKLKKEKKLSNAGKLYTALARHNEAHPSEIAMKYAPVKRAEERKKPSALLEKEFHDRLRDANGIVLHGDPDVAKVVLYEFSDLQCPYCSRGHDTLNSLKKNYSTDQLAIVTFHYPLPFHKQALPAHKALVAAANQGKGAEMQELIFSQQKVFPKSKDVRKSMIELASELSLDLDQFEKDFDASETEEKIEEDMVLGKELEVQGTPSFFVNDQRLVGAQPLKKFEEMIDAALEK